MTLRYNRLYEENEVLNFIKTVKDSLTILRLLGLQRVFVQMNFERCDGISNKQTNNNDLLEKDGGTKNCIYKD